MLIAVWDVFKTYLVDLTGISKDALHVHIGLMIYVCSALLLKKKYPGAVFPWMIVFGLEIANELVDLFVRNRAPDTVAWLKSLKDIVNTMFWPTLFALASRMRGRRALMSRKSGHRSR
ncbi:MAG: hypothetical protein ACK4QP_13490 [Pseudorhizobium sp.]